MAQSNGGSGMSVDAEKIRKGAKEIIAGIGEDPGREGLVGTPQRLVDMYSEIFSGIHMDAAEVLSKGFSVDHREMVIVRDIPFYSMCEHHFLPFYGVAHIGYIPNSEGRVVGVSKLARVVEIFSRRPQLQERMTKQIADVIMETLRPSGVGVIIQAEHLCMIMRGVRKPGSKVITSAMRGGFERRPATRAEFMSLVEGK
jgi:GTP cyclohydrolase IA